MADILVVTKDIAELIYQPVVALLRAAGHRVTVIAEGLSLDKWFGAGEAVYGGKPSAEKVDDRGCRYDIEEHEVIQKLAPNLILTGLGAPINLGERFGLAANERGIKLGYAIDVWGAETRSRAVPSFICTLDEFGAEKIRSHLSYQGRMPKIHITGSPAMDHLASVKVPSGILGPLNVLADDERWPIVLFAGQDESSTPALEGLITALNNHSRSYILIPRFHPKFLAREDLRKVWDELLRKAKGYVLYVPLQISIQQIMKVSGYTVSIYSNALIEAATLGSLPVSFVSDVGRQKMSEVLGGLSKFPLVNFGCCIEVETAEEFKQVLDMSSESYQRSVRHCQSMYKIDGKNSERVFNVIQSEISETHD